LVALNVATFGDFLRTNFCTVFLKENKGLHSIFHHNLGKSRPIYKIHLRSDSWGNFVYKYHKDSPRHLKHVFTLPCETLKLQLLPISTAYCTWDLRIRLADMRSP